MAKKFGRYELVSELGRGGQAVVYEARDPELGRSVALKVLLPGTRSLNSARRFQREARAAAKLNHPNIVSIYDVGEWQSRHYMAMELVAGETLADALHARKLGATETIEIVEKVAGAVAEAHATGIVHRDIKPANIILDSDGTPKLMDFGLALDIDASTQLTQTGTVMGTAAYMAPEQARGRSHEVDERSDVYSLGATLYEMLTGRPPFKAQTSLMLLSKICHDAPKNPSEIRRAVPPDAATICMKCLEKEPPRRYQSAKELARDCRRFLAGEPISARPVSALYLARMGLARHKGLATGVVSVIVALLVGLAAAVQQWRKADAALVRASAERRKALEEKSRAEAAEAAARDAESKAKQALALAESERNKALEAKARAEAAEAKLEEALARVGRLLAEKGQAGEALAEARKALVKDVAAAAEAKGAEPEAAGRDETWKRFLVALHEAGKKGVADAGGLVRRERELLRKAGLGKELERAEGLVRAAKLVEDLAEIAFRGVRGTARFRWKGEAVAGKVIRVAGGVVSLRTTLGREVSVPMGEIAAEDVIQHSRLMRGSTKDPVKTGSYYLLRGELDAARKVVAGLASEKAVQLRADIDEMAAAVGGAAAEATGPQPRASPGGAETTFQTAKKAPARFDAWTFFWIHPETDAGAELSYVVRQPDGKDYFRWGPRRVRAGDGSRSSFSKEFAGGDPSVFFDQHIRFTLRVSKGKMKFPPGAKSHFLFHKRGADGKIDWRKSIATVGAVVRPTKGRGKPGEPLPTLTLDLGGGVTMEFVYVKPGVFMMGGNEDRKGSSQGVEKPKHEVAITRGFYIGRYEVTRGQFAAFVKATAYRTEAEKEGKAWGRHPNAKWGEIQGASWRRPVYFTQTEDHPVICMSWNDVKAFCDWAAARTRRGVRLPTEAEWEYACRAGTTTRFSFGGSEGALSEYAWHDKTSNWQTHPVGQKKANAWGLHDVHGNVWEWVADWYDAGYYAKSPRENPAGPVRGRDRLLRGGSWHAYSYECRSAIRHHWSPSNRGTGLGFRAAVSAPPESAGRPRRAPGETVSFAGHRYKLCRYALSWDEAKLFCERLGGHLATIASKAENSFLTDLARKGDANVWIGLSDQAKEGSWKWVTGEKADFLAWSRGEPKGGRRENCAALPAAKDSAWFDCGAQGMRFFVCEWEPGTGTPASVASEEAAMIPTGSKKTVLYGESFEGGPGGWDGEAVTGPGSGGKVLRLKATPGHGAHSARACRYGVKIAATRRTRISFRYRTEGGLSHVWTQY